MQRLRQIQRFKQIHWFAGNQNKQTNKQTEERWLPNIKINISIMGWIGQIAWYEFWLGCERDGATIRSALPKRNICINCSLFASFMAVGTADRLAGWQAIKLRVKDSHLYAGPGASLEVPTSIRQRPSSDCNCQGNCNCSSCWTNVNASGHQEAADLLGSDQNNFQIKNH